MKRPQNIDLYNFPNIMEVYNEGTYSYETIPVPCPQGFKILIDSHNNLVDVVNELLVGNNYVAFEGEDTGGDLNDE